MAIANNREPGWWYPWLFVGGLGIVVAVNSVLVYFAINSWTGLETKDHFVKGLAYNQTLDEQTKQKILGWNASVTYGANGILSVVFVDGKGMPINDLLVETILYRPSQDDVDSKLDLPITTSGTYKEKLQLPLPGLWEVRLKASRGDDVFRLRHRIQAP